MAGVRLTGLVKQFDGPVAAVENLTLDIADGEFHVLVGPSGCGKTTVLRLIAGLEEPTAGSITIGDRDVTWLPPRDRDVAMVFQNYALYPHLNVWDNIAFGLRMRRVPRATIARQVAAAADLLAIGDLLRRRPGQLSGGQRQRVALARAIVREPRVFLFDEPLSNLDAQVRAHTRAELVKLHRRLGTTMIYVTHDQVEAMTMAQRVSVLHAGRVLQVAPPLELYRRPATRFVASFIGSPAINQFPGRVVADGSGARFTGTLTVAVRAPALAGAVLAVRPEHLELVPEDAAGAAPATMVLVEPLGPESHVLVRFEDGVEATARVAAGAPWTAGGRLGVRVAPDSALVYDGATGRLVSE